ncbi:MAG: hypothetical protein PHT02_06615 [Tissierellia bacterium]|nr:hypothetical protein [Tissierellia bacterium]
MKINIISESGDWKEQLYTKDIVTYEIKNQEIIDFFNKLSESYNNDEVLDDMYECLYNLLNYGYLYSDVDYENDFTSNYDNYDEYEDYDDDYEFKEQEEGIVLIDTEIEYYVDNEQVSKEEYDDAWDERIGYLGSSNWEEEGLSITNAETEEVLFFGKIS